MTGKEEYEIAIVSKYKEAKKALEILNDSELKLAVFSKCNNREVVENFDHLLRNFTNSYTAVN